MTAPSYTEDLSDVDLAANDTNWEECSATNWDTGGASTYDTDYPYIQGNGAVTQQATKAAIGGLMVDNGSGITLPTDGAFFVWQVFASNRALDTYANGGMRVVVGSDRSNFYSWDVGGSDKGRYPYGGWMNHVVNTGETADDTVGSPTTTERYIGAAYKSLSGIGKGNPHGVDAIRYGRGSSIFEFGDLSNGYCTFAGYAAQNDNSSNMWGLVQDIGGSYLYKGKMTLGTATNAVDFRDDGELILIDDTPKATTGFNKIEVNNASSRVDMTNMVFKALGTHSPGTIDIVDNADINIEACQFVDMGVIALGGTNSEFLSCVFKGCSTIHPSGGKINGSQVIESSVSTGTGAIQWSVATDPDGFLDDLYVKKHSTTAHHAIYLGNTIPSEVTIRNLDASGFNASDGQNDSTFYVADSAGTITINCVGCTGNMTYRSNGATVIIVEDPVTVKVTATDATGTAIENARVLLAASDGTGPFPYEETVTIVNSGTTATVTHTAHGMATGDKVLISGGSLSANKGVFQITLDGTTPADKYSYTMSSTPGSSPTGTITSTFVALSGLTDVNGELSAQRVYGSDQPVTGWARKSSASPFYKTGPLGGAVDSADGYNNTAVLTADE